MEENKEYIINSLKINNTYYTHEAIRFGVEGESKVFGGITGNDKDWYLLTIKGKNKNNQETGTVEIYLADYRFDNNRDNYIISSWTNIELEQLGYISSLELTLTSSDNTTEGKIRTPAYVCIDEIKITAEK